MLSKDETHNCLREAIKKIDVSYVDAIGALMASFALCMHLLKDEDIYEEMKKICDGDRELMIQYIQSLAISSKINETFHDIFNEKLRKNQNP